MLSFQSSGVNCSEFDAPEPDCFSGYGDTSLGEEILDIAMAEIEAKVQPDSIGNDIGWGAPSRKRCRSYVLMG